MIGRSILFMLFFFGLHLLITRTVAIEESPPLYTWQGNILGAEGFLYGDQDYENVIVGSSLGARITPELLPSDNWYNLSFGGLSIFDGLRIVNASGNFPEVILIEVNVLDRAPNKSFNKTLNRQPKRVLREQFNYLTEQQKPQLQVQQFAEKRIVRKVVGKMELAWRNMVGQSATKDEAPANDPEIDGGSNLEAAKAHNIDVNVERYQTYDAELIAHHLDLLDELLNPAIDAGSQLVFFEMPVSDALCDLPRPTYIYDVIQERYKDKPNTTVLERADCAAYTTTDGLHLGPEAIERFSADIFQKLNI